jgi:hypothetical protein
LEDIKEVIRIRKLKKDRQHNGQTKKYKKTNNDQQTTYDVENAGLGLGQTQTCGRVKQVNDISLLHN